MRKEYLLVWHAQATWTFRPNKEGSVTITHNELYETKREARVVIDDLLARAADGEPIQIEGLFVHERASPWRCVEV